MPTYTLWAKDALGMTHSCHGVQSSNRQGALQECKEFFAKDDHSFEYNKWWVTNSTENRKAYLKAWTCACCNKSPEKSPDRNFFMDPAWKDVVPKKYLKKVLCRECFEYYRGKNGTIRN